MNDLISRKWLIEAVEEGWIKFDTQKDYNRIIHLVRDIAPSAQPERRKGKWDFMGWQMFQCSECKHTFTQDFLEGWREYTYEPFFPPFCPNCGADMRGEQDD